jgi:hypothetical protein
MDMQSGQWICMDTLMDNNVYFAEPASGRHDCWISMYYGYRFRLVLDIDVCIWIQKINIWICKGLGHG